MVKISEVKLKGEIWENLLNSVYQSIFKTIYNVYSICISIGIMYDKQVNFDDDQYEGQRYVPVTMLYQKKEELEILFQTAILTTKNVDFTEDQRLELAFGDKEEKDFNKLQFLTMFANYGATVLYDLVTDDKLETMENIKNFVTSTVEGTNFNLDPLQDEAIDVSDEDL